MRELKKYLEPSLVVIEIGDYVFTDNSDEFNEFNKMEDPYGGSGWWEKK